ncbi:MAG: hypothetical protein KDC43_29845 [Saprospiraceae bacterium]|nr:hypothetical protein [Saprospiraceae bacterium]
MIGSMLAGILLLQVAPAASLFCFIGTYYAGKRAGAEDESQFMGIIFVLAVIGFVALIAQGLISRITD